MRSEPDPTARAADPTARAADPTVPAADPAVPAADPAVPAAEPAVPAADPAVPTTDPTVLPVDPAARGAGPAGSSAPEPPPLTKPARSALTMRDMVGAVVVLALLVLVSAGITRSCSFTPAGPTIDPTGLPAVDAPATLRGLRVGFPVRIPAVPPGWRSNSAGQDRVEGGGRAVRVGYLPPDGRYLRLLQSDAAEPALLAVEAGSQPVAARGPVEVAGQKWVVYARGNGEPIWIADVPAAGGTPVRLLITGSGSDEDVRVLAGAVLAGELLPARAPR